MTDPLKAFSGFKDADFAVLRWGYLREQNLAPLDLAKIVINAAEEGKKPVNFRLRSDEEYWGQWTAIAGNGRLLLAAFDHLGYKASYQTNKTSDGLYLLLEKKAIPSDIPFQPRP